MATMITGDELRQAVEKQTFIKGGDPGCAEGIKYDFRSREDWYRQFEHSLERHDNQIKDIDRRTENGEGDSRKW